MDYSGVIKVLSYLCHLHINVPAPSVEKWACLDCYSASASQTECVFIVNLAPRRVEIRTSSSFWCGFIYEIISLRIKNLLGKIFFFFFVAKRYSVSYLVRPEHAHVSRKGIAP